MSERETCWLVEKFIAGKPSGWWLDFSRMGHSTRIANEARRYTELEARVVADALRNCTADTWEAVKHTFDPPKTPGQRLYEVFASLNTSTYGEGKPSRSLSPPNANGAPRSRMSTPAREGGSATAAKTTRLRQRRLSAPEGKRSWWAWIARWFR